MKKSLIIIFLIISLIYTVNIDNIPKRVILFEDEELNLGEIIGIKLRHKTNEIIQTSNNNKNIEEETLEVALFNIISVKDVEVKRVERTKVIPLGNTVGIKLYSDGVLVIGMTEIEGKKPYENTGIKEGDLIKTVDNIKVSTTEDLIKCVNESNGNNIEIVYQRNGEKYTVEMEPVKTKEDEYKIGLWVRDGAVGIGTATYYEPENGLIATLGHGIVDRDTDNLIEIARGELLTSQITTIKKGEKGNPGEIRGIIDDKNEIGTINKNTEYGIYGIVNNKAELRNKRTKQYGSCINKRNSNRKSKYTISFRRWNKERI